MRRLDCNAPTRIAAPVKAAELSTVRLAIYLDRRLLTPDRQLLVLNEPETSLHPDLTGVGTIDYECC